MRILAIGAHPDDVEIGAAGLISKLIADHHDVFLLILTDDPVLGLQRQKEAINSAQVLGIPRDRVRFAGMKDGYVRADRDSVTLVRQIAASSKFDAEIVVVHTQADSHNDHVESNRIAHAAFRGCVFLQYSIHISSEVSAFEPRMFIELTSARRSLKAQALAQHVSQISRIVKSNLESYERLLGKRADLDAAEAFEISVQNDSAEVFAEVIGLSESPFHSFWMPLIRSDTVSLMYEAFARPGATIDWPTTNESAGRDVLRQSFAKRWYPLSPLEECASSDSNAVSLMNSGPVILAGGAVSNTIVRDFYNRFKKSVWVVEYDLPRTEHAYLLNKGDGTRLYPEIGRSGEVLVDFGLLANVLNPFNGRHRIICVAGTTGFATRAGLQFLSNPGDHAELNEALTSEGDVQVAFKIASSTGEVQIIAVH